MVENASLNYIKVNKNIDENRYYNFSSLVFVQNGKVVIEEKEIYGFILCEIDYGKSINYIAGKNTRLKYDDFYAEFDKPFKDYFIIFVKVSYGELFGHLMDYKTGKHYIYTRTVLHNGNIIEQKDWCKPIPLINPYNELLWESSREHLYEPTCNINKKTYINIQNIEDITEKIKHPILKDDEFIYFYFHQRECLSCYMALELCKNADDFAIVPNIFDDDNETINYCAKFSKDRIKDIAFLYQCVNTRGLGNSAYFNNLYGSKPKGFSCVGSAIYNIPYAEYLKGLDWVMNLRAQFLYTNEQKNNFKELVKVVYSKYNLQIDYSKLPECFTQKLVLEDEQLNQLEYIVDNNYFKWKDVEISGQMSSYNKKKLDNLKKQYAELKQNLILNNKYSTKWKSEFELFKLVHAKYKDTIYQYKANWLGLQSLDIYVPSQKLAFEYQGLQHYEPIDFWGGKEGLKYRQKLDEQKRKLCKENNVKLIEWRYDEPISKIMLDKKLKMIED